MNERVLVEARFADDGYMEFRFSASWLRLKMPASGNLLHRALEACYLTHHPYLDIPALHEAIEAAGLDPEDPVGEFQKVLDINTNLHKTIERRKVMLDEARAEIERLRERQEVKRHSLAQEIRDALRSRGFHAPSDCDSDLIPAVGRALDALRAENERLREEVALTERALARRSHETGIAIHEKDAEIARLRDELLATETDRNAQLLVADCLRERVRDLERECINWRHADNLERDGLDPEPSRRAAREIAGATVGRTGRHVFAELEAREAAGQDPLQEPPLGEDQARYDEHIESEIGGSRAVEPALQRNDSTEASGVVPASAHPPDSDTHPCVLCRVCGAMVCPDEDCQLHPEGAEFSDGTWACSRKCWDKHADSFDEPEPDTLWPGDLVRDAEGTTWRVVGLGVVCTRTGFGFEMFDPDDLTRVPGEER